MREEAREEAASRAKVEAWARDEAKARAREEAAEKAAAHEAKARAREEAAEKAAARVRARDEAAARAREEDALAKEEEKKRRARAVAEAEAEKKARAREAEADKAEARARAIAEVKVAKRKEGLSDNRTPGDMVEVPAGTFTRGSRAGVGTSDERPQGAVYVSGFWIDKTEVTVDAYAACVKAGGCTRPSTTSSNCNWGVSGRGEHPVNCVDWNQSDTYCRWAGKRLPTEGEWEKAARGTDGRTYPWGEATPSCRYAVMNEGGDGCGKDRTWAVGSKPAGVSPYGALDMSGNVWEWVSDWYSSNAYTDAASMRDPHGPVSDSFRVNRGGSFSLGAGYLRAADRNDDAPALAYSSLGFRCARSMP